MLRGRHLIGTAVTIKLLSQNRVHRKFTHRMQSTKQNVSFSLKLPAVKISTEAENENPVLLLDLSKETATVCVLKGSVQPRSASFSRYSRVGFATLNRYLPNSS